MNYKLIEGKQRGLLTCVSRLVRRRYISGPAAKMYINDELFRSEGIRLRYMDYSKYPEYNQLSPFEHGVSYS